ncbi:unnamed protein product [Lepeophtheirus salmonis]|uniref:(salmon louse) hypothetical protein n=1 Tax=Lepeophtheirus salmonis TaxID=72036 RepID=A0A7R8H882_LEPSM|nr:unnamed protein product [Lepeophtheirus salmonis]CAF2937163.1 unnamed protein product [Lepeophtheirus salmonis]
MNNDSPIQELGISYINVIKCPLRMSDSSEWRSPEEEEVEEEDSHVCGVFKKVAVRKEVVVEEDSLQLQLEQEPPTEAAAPTATFKEATSRSKRMFPWQLPLFLQIPSSPSPSRKDSHRGKTFFMPGMWKIIFPTRQAQDTLTLVYKKHRRVHTHERPFACQLCPYKAKDSSQLTVHLRSHTGDSPFICPHEGCASSFKTNSDLKRHVLTIKSNLESHISSNHRKAGGYQCKLCNFQTDRLTFLKEHKKSHSSTLLKCALCDFTSTTQMALSAHVRKKHGPKHLHHCSYCDFTCRWEGALSAHVNKKHGRSAGDSKTTLTKSLCNPNFRCHLCNAGFVREDSLSSHLRQHKSPSQGIFSPPLPHSNPPEIENSSLKSITHLHYSFSFLSSDKK